MVKYFGNVSIKICQVILDKWWQIPHFYMYLLDPIPSVSDGIVDREVCRMGANDSCEETMTIKVKNCQTFRVYYLIRTNGCPKAYCFGKNCNCSLFKVLPACAIILYTSMHQIWLPYTCFAGNKNETASGHCGKKFTLLSKVLTF